MTLTSKGYQSDFGTVSWDKIPQDIAAAFIGARLTKAGYLDARPKSNRTAIKAKEQLDQIIWEAWKRADKETLYKLGLKYY